MEGAERDCWKEFLAQEPNDLWEKGIFREGSPQQGAVLVKTRFVFTIESAADGNVERYRSKFVRKELTQRSGDDFFETRTFGPVVGFDTMRAVLIVSASKGCNINALGFKQEHINTPLSEGMWLELG